MANRELTKTEWWEEDYAWHIIGTGIYHLYPECPDGHDLTSHRMEDFIEGTGGYTRCHVCTRLLLTN